MQRHSGKDELIFIRRRMENAWAAGDMETAGRLSGYMDGAALQRLRSTAPATEEECAYPDFAHHTKRILPT